MDRRDDLTGMRGFAATIVVLFHIWIVWADAVDAVVPGRLENLLAMGWIGVDLFFVLSGFLLAQPFLQARQATWTNYAAFMARRYVRVVPAYAVALVFALVVTGTLERLWLEPKNVALHLLLLHSFHPEAMFDFNVVFWTLAVEFQFYLVLPLMALALRGPRGYHAALLFWLGSVVWLAAAVALPSLAALAWSYQLPSFLGHFALGIAVRKLAMEGRVLRNHLGLLAMLGAGLFVLAPFLLNGILIQPRAWSPDVASQILMRPLLAVGWAFLLFLAAQPASPVRTAFAARPWERLGRVSYSLYLTHMPILVVIPQAWTQTSAGLLAALGVFVATTTVATTVLFHLVERPSLAVRVGLRSPKPPAVSPRPATAVSLGERAIPHP